jgi:predicted GNAT family acetyltransferase
MIMTEIKLQLDQRGRGAFYLEEEGTQIGEMVVGISGTALTVYHTEVNPGREGKGLAGRMFDEMVHYARKHGLQVIPLCVYVHARFKRHPADFEDIWRK